MLYGIIICLFINTCTCVILDSHDVDRITQNLSLGFH